MERVIEYSTKEIASEITQWLKDDQINLEDKQEREALEKLAKTINEKTESV